MQDSQNMCVVHVCEDFKALLLCLTVSFLKDEWHNWKWEPVKEFTKVWRIEAGVVAQLSDLFLHNSVKFSY